MATNTLKLRISNKVDTRANWGSSSLVLKKGELAFDEMNTFKIGNGTATWSELPFAGGGAVKITTVDPTASDTGYDLGQLWLNTTSSDLFVMSAAGVWEKVVFAADLTAAVESLEGKIALKANAADVYTKTEADALINVKANAADVYTKTESDSALALKANAADVYTKTAADELLAKKADLDENGHVLTSQLPSYVDDVIEGASLESFPAEGESGKIYVALDTNKTYRWSGTQYTVISDTIALGVTAGTAYEGSAGAELANRITTLENVISGGEAGGLGALAYLNTVATAQIDDSAVTTAKIGDAQVTDAKIVSLSLDKITESAGAEVVLDCGDSSEA